MTIEDLPIRLIVVFLKNMTMFSSVFQLLLLAFGLFLLKYFNPTVYIAIFGPIISGQNGLILEKRSILGIFTFVLSKSDSLFEIMTSGSQDLSLTRRGEDSYP